MSQSLATDARDAFYANALDTAAWAEAVTYYPVSGAARSVVAKITHNRERRESGEVDSDVERITVTVGRQETHAKGGVASPAIGDSLLRSGDEARYAFTGEAMASGPHAWRLVFERPRPRRLGTSFERR